MTLPLLSNEIVASVLGRVLDLVTPDVGRAEMPRQLEEATEYGEFKEFNAVYGIVFGLSWLIIVPYMTRHYEHHHPRRRQPACLQFLQSHERSFDKFTAGSMQEAPPKPRSGFQAAYQADRMHLYGQIFHSVLFQGHLMIVFVGTVALALAWLTRNAEAVSDRVRGNLGTERRRIPKESIIVGLECVARAQQIILPLASVLISTYVIYRIWRLHRAMDTAWKVQGSIHDIAILLGALLAPYRAEPGVREVLWTVHRHINLIHFFSYSNACRDVSWVSERLEMVSESGLLIGDEPDNLCAEVDARIYSVFSWLLASVDRLVEVQLISQAYAPVVIEALGELQEATHNLAEEGRAASRPILATLHMVRILGDTVTLLTPPALVHLFRSDTTGVYFWSMAGSMIVAVFYQGAVSLTKVLEHPFADEYDGLSASWALMTTERKVFACLAGGDGTGSGGGDDDWAVTPAGLTDLARKAVMGEKVPVMPPKPVKMLKSKPTLISDIYHPKTPDGQATKLFETQEDGWSCDVCGTEFHAGTHLFGSLDGSWDICQPCAAKAEADELAAPVEVEGAPVEEEVAVPPPATRALAPAAQSEPSEFTEDMEDPSEFDVADEAPPSEASVRGEGMMWDVGSEAGSLAISEGGPQRGSLRAKSASRLFDYGVGGPESESLPLDGQGPTVTRPPREDSMTVDNAPGMYRQAPAMPIYNPSAAVNLSRDLIQATYVALREPREIILDEASLERLETVTTRPLTELASALIDVQGGGSTGKVFGGKLNTVAEEDDEGSPPRDTAGPTIENGSLRAPPEPKSEIQATQSERVILDLIGQFHSELQSASDLRSQAAAIRSGVASVPPSQSMHSAQPPSKMGAGPDEEIQV
mmetsp:Transcript_125671/g.235060  ORF Transcript_125671/g.235060 Transcript_125671/m.235060 type:complete len:872 (+) Transcript_125671:23-2638(+)